MKTIIEKATRRSKYILKDDQEIIATEKTVQIGNVTICDLNKDTIEIQEVLEIPEDWVGDKYCYQNGFIRIEDLTIAKQDRIREANQMQRSILLETDGYIIRRAETGKSVPQTILNERQAIRVRTTAIEAEITAMTTLQEVLEYQIHFNTTQS